LLELIRAFSRHNELNQKRDSVMNEKKPSHSRHILKLYTKKKMAIYEW
jgi:hypothetical protein